MKRTIAWILVLVLCLGVFAGCAKNPTGSTPSTTVGAEENDGLQKAAKYLKALYNGAPEKTSADYERTSVVPVGNVKYTVTWSVDVSEDLVKVIPGETVTVIDVKEENDTETPYVLTATVSDAEGNTKTVTFNHILPVAFGDNMGAIVDAAYELESGAKMDAPVTLTGEIIRIDTPWDAGYANITVTIEVKGKEDKPIMCYRLKGDGADALKIGDTITVTGTIKNYNGTIEFDAGCTLDKVVPGETVEAITDPDQLLDAAYALEAGKALPFNGTLTGVITSVDTAFSPDYGNVTVTIVVNGKTDKPVQCYRLKGTGADLIAVGDTITVTGGLMNYNGKVQFSAGCVLDAYTKGEGGTTDPQPTDPQPTEPKPTDPVTPPASDPAADSTLSVKDAIALGTSKAHNTYTAGKYYVTGTITEIYNTQYGNMKISDASGNILTIYGTYSADGSTRFDAMSSQPKVGDEVTIYGIIGQYNETPQIKNGWIVKVNGKAPSTEPVNPPAPPASNLSVVGSLTAGKAYKFGMVQQMAGKTVYLAGGMSGFYMATTEDASAAVDVYVEETAGGYYLYAMISGTKTYINMVKAVGTDGKEHINGMYETAPSTVYTWDAEAKTLIADLDGEAYWHGTRSDKSYLTVGPCAVKYEGFYCQFYA